MTTHVSMYVRLSEDRYDTGAGVARQEAECRAFAAARGWTIREVFVDNDISATTGKRRPGFEALLASKPDAILVWHTDRLVRLTKELERVIDLRVNVHAVQTGHLDLSTPAGRATAITVTAWAQYEGEQKSERQKLAASQRADSGKPWWPTRPFGFEMDATHREAEASALAKAYRDLLAGYTLARVARDLAGAGHVTNKGNPWKAASLRPVLLNPRNAGIRAYNGTERGAASWDPIVPVATYRAVVRLLSDPERQRSGGAGGRGRRTNLLTGFATCGKCGATMRAAWRGKADAVGSYKVYGCSANHCVTYPADFVDGRVFLEVIRHTGEWAALLATETASATGAELDELRAEESALLSRKAQLGEMFAAGTIGGDTLASGVATANARLDEVVEKLRHRASDDFWGLDYEDLAELVETDPEKWRQFLLRVCESIRIMPRGKGNSKVRNDDVVVDFKAPRNPTTARTTRSGSRLSLT